MMEAADDTIVEVFEWKSSEALESTYTNPAIQAMWQEYADVCKYIPISEVEEAGDLFSEFAPFE
jgi:hypothetical protein